MSLARDLVKSGVIGGWVGGCVDGWKERKMDVVGRRYGKGLSNEEEVREKKGVVCRGRKGKDGLLYGKLRGDPASVVRREEGCT